MNAVVLSVGNELVTGQTVDTNSAYLSLRLAEFGVETIEHRTIRDDLATTAMAFREAAGSADLLVVTGGLGPTADDLTRQALAEALGTELVLDPASLAVIEEFFRRRGRELNEINRVQAMVPRGAQPLDNPIGTAPGLKARIDGTDIYVFPGVPAEMRLMFDRHLAPALAATGSAIVHRTVQTFGAGESDIGLRIGDLMARDADPLVGTTAAGGMVGVRITARGADRQAAEAAAQAVENEIRRRLGELVVGREHDTLAAAVGELLRAAGQTVVTAESCTGGLLGKLLTDAPGSSNYYLGGVVAYANAVKCDLLGVPREALHRHGAVSQQVAEAMAVGARSRLAADWAISTTGIAGPTGGSEEKPVGTVWTALAGPDGVRSSRLLLPGDRDLVRLRAAHAVLNALRLALATR